MNKKERLNIAKTWRKRRKELGFTLEQFAEKYRFDKAQLSRWEKGDYSPSVTSIERVEKAFWANAS